VGQGRSAPARGVRRTASRRDPEIVAQAKEHGLIAHRFYGSDGQILIADEWPDEESFVRFAEAARPEIEPMFQAVGVTVEPHTIWRKLETHDDVGWGA
jgi:hypothetical protein